MRRADRSPTRYLEHRHFDCPCKFFRSSRLQSISRCPRRFCCRLSRCISADEFSFGEAFGEFVSNDLAAWIDLARCFVVEVNRRCVRSVNAPDVVVFIHDHLIDVSAVSGWECDDAFLGAGCEECHTGGFLGFSLSGDAEYSSTLVEQYCTA